MKLLRIQATGLPLFKEGIDLSFYARQRVTDSDKDVLAPLYPDARYYLNCANALIGINASGKTSALKVVLLALDILNHEPINHSETKDILGETQEAVFILNFYSDKGELCRLETHIVSCRENGSQSYCIKEETLWVKPVGSANTKKSLTDFTGIQPYSVRTNTEDFLPDDISIIIAYSKKNGQQIPVASLLSMTDVNVLPVSDEIPADVIQFLDPTVETLSFRHEGRKLSIVLKFLGEREIVLSDPAELNRYLSSGTIKGIVAFALAIQTLRTGGYLILDELENHFNKEIAVTLMRLFMDTDLNHKGAILIFSTHYPEILDEFERNDSIYITRNRGGLTVSNLTDILKRNDIKKSDVYQSGMLDGTVPAYEAYLKLRKKIRTGIAGEG